MWEFSLSSIADLRELAERLGVRINAIEDVSILAEAVKAGDLLIPNSLAVHPMEGCDGDFQGRPGKLTFRRYERFAAGGAGLIWGEATAVVPEGRANPRQLWLNQNNKDSFAAMVKKMREAAPQSLGRKHKPVIVLQLTHSGRYSRPNAAQPIIVQHDPYRDALVPQKTPSAGHLTVELGAKSKIPDDWPIVTDQYLDQLQDAYVEAARIAFEVGFDAVDVKSCHGYLINELLACRLAVAGTATDPAINCGAKYRGTFENRTRFLLDVIDKIHGELGKDKPIVTRLGVYDGIPYPYGWGVPRFCGDKLAPAQAGDDYAKPDLTEPKKLIELLRQRDVKLINITAANPYYNPHISRPFNEPIVGGYEEPEHPLVGVVRLINLAGEIQKQFPDLAIVGTGYSWLRTLFANVAAANKANGLVTLAGAGRMAFAYPDFARDILIHGKMLPEKVCVSCSACTQIMRDGGMAGCVVRDNQVYGPIFRLGRMSDRDNLARLAQTCRKCQEPTCQLACPAGVDIPRFISLFLDGDDRAAYEVLKQANIFPEVCAWLCPVEQQCQGNCLQRFIGDGPLPIADIQRYLAEKANKNDWSKLRVPKRASGKRVAIIGAGPAGLSCAAKLVEAGHTVTIFDKNTELGGLIESAIPPSRYSDSLKGELAAIFADVPEDRLIKRLGRELDADFNLDTIMSEGFNAAFIGLGLAESESINSKKLVGLFSAMEFLGAAKEPGRLDLAGKSVAVIGGGNTAMDVATTAAKLGARDVYVIYRRSFKEMPAWSRERDQAMSQGVHFLILTQPLEYVQRNGKLAGIKLCPTKLGEPDASGRRRPELIESSAYELDMNVVVEAIGQVSPENIAAVLPGVKFVHGLIQTKGGTTATSRPGVFAGGDLVRGPSTVVAAVADGMKAAKEINEFLTRHQQ